MDLNVTGRHALFFDDDQMASFVNSIDALVIWNSIPIDRYDVRHLLTTPPSSRRSFRRHGSSSPPLFDSSLQSDLDHQRFMDLPTHGEYDLQSDDPLKVEDGYHKVGFSYTGSDPPAGSTSPPDTGTGFRPAFPLPPALLGHTLIPASPSSSPDSEKTHQIIARTALFVQRQGVQSEFILRVKQGDNPKFGFLSPGHYLHPYFRYLVDNRVLLATIQPEKPHPDAGDGSGASALSLLGSVYGSVEDENHGSSMSADDVGRTEIQFELAGKEEPGNPFEVKGSSYFTALKTDNYVDPPREMNKVAGRMVKTPGVERGIVNEANKRRRLPSEEKSRLLGQRNPKGDHGTTLPSKKKQFPKICGVREDVLCENEKSEMVIGESKNGGLNIGPPSTSPRADFGVSVDATAAAAILQAATRGIRNPSLSVSLSGTWIDPTAGIRSEAHQPDPDGLTKEQKLKSERLKKAKLFLLGLNSSGPVSASAQDSTEAIRERTWDRYGSVEGRGRAREERGERGNRREEELEEGEIGFKERCRKNGGRRKRDRFVKLSEDVR